MREGDDVQRIDQSYPRLVHHTDHQEEFPVRNKREIHNWLIASFPDEIDWKIL